MVKCSLNLISYIQRQRKSGCWKCRFQLLKICEDFDQTCYDQTRTPQTNAIYKNPLRSWSTKRPTVSWLRFCNCARVHLTCATIPSVCHTVCVEMMTLLLIFYFFVSYLVFDILENNEENLVKDFRTVFWTKKFPFVRFNINTKTSHWTHRDEEFLLLLFLLLGFLSHHLVFLLELLQCSDLRLLEAKCLLLIVRSQPGELLLIALVFLAQRLRTRGRLEEVKRLFVTGKERIKKSTCSSLSTCCLCWSLAVWLWLSRTSLSSSSLLIFSLRRLCSWSKFLMVASWAIWVACKEPIWPESSQIEIMCVC